MYPVSSRFLKTIRRSGDRKTVVDVYQGAVKMASDIPVIDGSLKVDRNSRSRRSGSLTLGDPSFFPKVSSGLFAPYSTEIVIRSGLVYTDGSEELVPLGVFLVNDNQADEAEGLIPTIQFFDRAHRVYETSTHVSDGGPLMLPTNHPFSGSPAQTAIETILSYPAPGWPTNTLWGVYIDPALSNPILPGGSFEGDTDRWQVALDLAEIMGADVYFDVFGSAVVKPVPGITPDTKSTDAVFTINSGEDGVMISLSQNITRENTYNRVVMLGATPDGESPQAMAVVADTNPASPTYWNGLFGKKTLRVSNSRLVSDEQCLIAAQAKLKNSLGLSKNVSFGSIANPALDVGDIILVIYPDGTEEIHLLDSFDLPLGNGSMTGTTRTIQLAVG